MAGFIELIAKIKPKNNGKYPLVDDVDVEMEDGSRLSEAIKKPRIPDGGTEGQILAKKSNTNGDAEWVEPLKTEDIDKKLESKLDKNLGSENSDKVLITDAEGNIITQNKEDFEGGGGTTDYNNLENKPQINGVELNGNKTSGDLKMYTQEEVDDLLYDKMDKPYKPITITDDITIEDCLDGYFKIDKIKGNTYQAEESDIVPTPQRPIPINSRKTTITKVNQNIFNLEKESDTSKIPDSGTYRSIGQHQLKPNTKYVFSWSEATVPAKATLSLQVQDDKGTVLVSPFTYFNLESTEKKETGKKVEFTTNESGIVKFAYNCTVGTSNTTETYQQYWYTKILKNITLKEDVKYESEYVELRSLKETSNLFDKNIMAFTSGTLNSDGTVGINASYAVSGFVPVGPSTQYTIKLIDGFRSSTKVYFDINKQAISNDGTTTFTTPSNCYFIRWQTATTDTRVLTEEDIQKINDEMMMVKGDSLPSTYVPPTVRDYKIVDHTTKTSKIVRNVGVYNLSNIESWSKQDDLSVYASIPNLQNDSDNLEYLVTDKLQTVKIIKKNYSIQPSFSYSWIVIRINEEVGNDNLKVKEWLQKNEVVLNYKLIIPTEESIPYVETDVSEAGLSWQDSTSPSPDIPSEIYEVKEINIKTVGKNLINLEKIDMNTIDTKIDVYFTSDVIIKCYETATVSTNIWRFKFDYKDGTSKHITDDKLKSDEYSRTVKSTKENPIVSITYRGAYIIAGQYSQIMLEYGNVSSPYEPYQEISIQHTLSKPLRATEDGSVADTIDIIKSEVAYKMVDLLKEYITIHRVHKKRTNTITFMIYNSNILHPTKTGITDTHINCNMFKVKAYNNDFDEEYICLYSEHPSYLFLTIDKKRLDVSGDEDTNVLKQKCQDYIDTLDIKISYETSKPTTEPLEDELVQKLKTLKTFRPTTHVFVTGIAKPTLNAKYPKDIAAAQAQLEQKVLLMSETLKNTQANLLLQGGND